MSNRVEALATAKLASRKFSLHLTKTRRTRTRVLCETRRRASSSDTRTRRRKAARLAFPHPSSFADEAMMKRSRDPSPRSCGAPPGTRAARGRDATRAGRSRRRFRTRARDEPADASRRETPVRSVLFDASRGWLTEFGFFAKSSFFLTDSSETAGEPRDDPCRDGFLGFKPSPWKKYEKCRTAMAKKLCLFFGEKCNLREN